MSRTGAVVIGVSLLMLTALAAGAEERAAEVEGYLVINGERIVLRHLVAYSGPGPIDDSNEMNYLLLSEKPISADDVAKAEFSGELFYVMGNGIGVRIEDDSFAVLSMRHPALGSGLIRTGVDALKLTANGPERIVGTMISAGADEKTDVSVGEHEVRYSATFDAPITRRFPLGGDE